MARSSFSVSKSIVSGPSIQIAFPSWFADKEVCYCARNCKYACTRYRRELIYNMELNSLLTRREMLGISGMAALASLTNIAAYAAPQPEQRKPRIACLVTYWAAPRSHADWIITKLLDGYWWQGAHTPSRVDVVSVYIHQLHESGLGQKICKSKDIPIFKTVGEAVMLGGKELAVDGVVIVGEHGEYPTNLKGQWMLPRWWIYQPPDTPYIRGFAE